MDQLDLLLSVCDNADEIRALMGDLDLEQQERTTDTPGCDSPAGPA